MFDFKDTLAYRIATKNNLLTPHFSIKRGIPIKAEVVPAKKFFVSDAMLPGDFDPVETLGGEYSPEEYYEKQINIWQKYARAPFPLIYIESKSGGGVVVKEMSGTDGRRMSIYSIQPNGIVLPGVMDIDLDKVGDSALAIAKLDITKGESEKVNRCPENIYKMILEVSVLKSLYLPIFILNILVYMNCRNSKMVEGRPTKQELKSIPDVIKPRFEYKIIDIFGSIKNSISFSSSMRELNDGTTQARRMTVVRGHYKTTKNGLFWWSPHVRNKENSKTVGVIDHDYRVS